ncbi:MAG TPA: OB-fold nucleic acid binding domain-containing protein, partial [Clostridia bacterium]|nr:OB-fold nucleic acid binding domain-containing protein [Clostridia bacterium]
MKIKLRDIQADPAAFVGEITVNGWVKTVRESKAAGFIELTDGSSFKPVQIVFFPSEGEQVYALSTGSAIRVT